MIKLLFQMNWCHLHQLHRQEHKEEDWYQDHHREEDVKVEIIDEVKDDSECMCNLWGNNPHSSWDQKSTLSNIKM